ncbi:MAG: hypothetical protein IAF02_04190 [Anaerolineae bacterium]|nr:hypothetical protein [Anaerolineae bacterium]
MKNHSKSLLLVLLMILAVVAFTACGGVSDPEAEPTAEPAPTEAPAVEEAATEEVAVAEEEAVVEEAAAEEAAVEEAVAETAEMEAEAVPAEEVAAPEMAMADALNLNIAAGNNQRTITYQQATPLELPDGTVISQGALKPTWQYIQEQLGIQLNDVTIQDQSAGEMMDVSAATSFDNAAIYGGNSIAEDFMSYGAQGYFVRLNDHLEHMPNFAAYLAASPNIAKAITAYDGGIYFVPYVAEIGNYARVFDGRETWVTALLDSDEALEAETHTLTPSYEGFWDRNATNVVDLQNEAAGGTLTRDVARDTLLAYIAETYPELENPSDLYLGETAVYDMDELVALWRVIELSPNTLSKVTTGDVIDGAEITPFFVRQTSYREDVLRLLNYFGGQRVHGSDSYAARFYLDANGELQYSYAEDSFLAGVDLLKDLYEEGLIHSEFADTSMTDNVRNSLYAADDSDGQQQFGFMTYDWIASTTASNPDVVGMLPPLTTVGDSDEFIHWTENTRVIKPDGWGISTAASEEEINAALYLLDYFFSDAGHIVQNYSPPYGLLEGETYLAPDGIEYPKFNEWMVDASCELKSCDMSGFLRDFIGSQIPIGYQKEIGFELQTTINHGEEAWALWIGAPVKSTSYESEDPLFRLVPPVFSLTEQDTAKLGQLAVGEEQVDQIFLYITGAETAVDSVEALKALYVNAGIDDYVDVYRNAYARMTE